MKQPTAYSPESVYIIAEIGVNHNGDMELARELVESAKKAGADAVKFQSFLAEDLATISTPKVPYQELNDDSTNHFLMLKSLELTHTQQEELKIFCESIEINFISTPYSVAEAKFLYGIGVRTFKIASADIVDYPLQEYVAHAADLAIVSTGMATKAEIEQVVNLYKSCATPLILLHCTSEYPTQANHAFMFRMNYLKEMGTIAIGFSDHTEDSIASIMAVALGARVIEKHITLDKKFRGPDHSASMEIEDFKKYCTMIRKSETMLGSGDFVRTELEEKMALTSRKSLHLTRPISSGEAIKENDLVLMRPGDGLYWSGRNLVIGKIAVESLPVFHKLELKDLR